MYFFYIDKKGDWILKEGGKQRKNYNNWKTRYLALEVDEKLSYYSGSDKKGEILTKSIVDCGFMSNYSGIFCFHFLD
jgi:hypothetical protein